MVLDVVSDTLQPTTQAQLVLLPPAIDHGDVQTATGALHEYGHGADYLTSSAFGLSAAHAIHTPLVLDISLFLRV